MCGIAGLIVPRSFDGASTALESMNRALAHRGPNSRGTWTESVGDWTVGLTHTRLAILDVSERGNQPMAGPRRESWMAYNGEIYNFQDLRRELDFTGPFVSGGDTEVILRGYDAWGGRLWDRLRGMFALGLWDAPRRQLHLVRDPLGIKPLYIYRTQDTLVFASEVRALLASGLVPRRASPSGLASYLRSGSVEAPASVVEGVVSLPPGHSLVVDVGGDRLRVAESPFGPGLFEAKQQARDRKQAVGELGEILAESVRAHLVSDVPLGVFLSGGIDSSALVALIQRVSKERPQTFSVVFAEREFTEASHAKLVSETYGTLHQEIPLGGDELLAMMPAAMAAMDQPSTDGVNTWVVSKAVREAGVTVALSGMGGDELFAGYTTFRRAARARSMAAIPGVLRRAAAHTGRLFTNGSVKQTKLWDMLASDGSAAVVHGISRRFFTDAEIGQCLDTAPPPASFAPFSEDPVNAMSECELRGYLVNTLLRDGDSMSMAHGLEVRVPFVDRVVVDYLLGLPGKWKLEPARPKPLLLDAIGGLPEQIWKRKKMGFSLPFRNWMQSSLASEIEETLESGSLDAAGIRRGTALQVWRRFISSPDREYWARPLALYGLAKWLGIHRVQA